MKTWTYEKAGVPHLKGDAFFDNKIKAFLRSTRVPGVMGSETGFAALFDFKKAGVKDPLLVSSTDGVGTKLEVARLQGRHDTIGIDLVAMCVNDIITYGAKPIFFLDYFATGKFDFPTQVEVLKGIAAGCREAGCALVGGETAVMPGFYSVHSQSGFSQYDLAGFCVGVADRKKIVTGRAIKKGDVLLGLASSGFHSNGFSLLRKVFSEEDLAGKIGKELLDHNPHLDEFFLIDTPWWQLVSTLKKKQIDTALVFHTSQRMVLPLCFLIGASKIVGTKGLHKGLDHLLTTALEQKPLHEIARRLEIVGGPPVPDPLLELFIDQVDRDAAEQFLAKHALPSYIPLIGIHPGAKDKFKQWHPSCFVKLGNELREHLGAQILVTGNASEKALATEIASKIPGAIPVAGELKVRPLAALIKKMGLFIANDTGPMHIAFAMRTPTIALFGPTDPKLCGPYFATTASVIRKAPTCAPCLRKSCREPFCLLQISPREVYDAALTLYYRR